MLKRHLVSLPPFPVSGLTVMDTRSHSTSNERGPGNLDTDYAEPEQGMGAQLGLPSVDVNSTLVTRSE